MDYNVGMRKWVLFLGPFALWCFLFRDFISGAIAFNMDTQTIYAVSKYYFNNVLNGVVPLWEPYVCLGRPFYALVICNLFNPITQIIILLKFLGFNYQQAFGIYISLYFLVGALGFYNLAKVLFKDKTIAYAAYVALIFSGVGASAFNQLTLLEIFVPAVWFFTFLLRFAERRSVGNFWGMTLSSMLLLISYLPFYFATLLFFTLLLSTAFYLPQLRIFLENLLFFIFKHKRHTILAVISMAIAAIPLFSYKLIDASHEAVAPARHCANADHMSCYNNTMNDQAGMSYEEASRSGGLGERLDIASSFSHLDKMTYGSDHFFFVPIGIFCLIAIGALAPIRRITVFLLALTLCLGLVALADAGQWHRVFFLSVPFFKYFRNLFFFEVFLMPLLILIGVAQMKFLMETQLVNWTLRKTMVVLCVAVHALAAMFLHHLGAIILTIWWTLAASAIVWTLFFLGLFKTRLNLFVWVCSAFFLIEPIQVFCAYAFNAKEFATPMAHDQTKAHFDWVRPTMEKPEGKIFQFVPYENFYYAMNLKDSSGYIGYSESATRWAFHLEQWMGDKALYEYARYKFILYDRTRQSSDVPYAINAAAAHLRTGEDIAYVSKGPEKDNGSSNTQALRIEGPNEVLNVDDFTVNSLKITTHLPQEKFLVYNDAFTSFWKAFINGSPVDIQRANFAFKGIWVPAGEAHIEFRYEPPIPGWTYIFVTVFFMLVSVLTIRCIWQEGRHADVG